MFNTLSIMKKRFYLFFILCLITLSGFAQEIKVTGVVTEASTNEPMPGVTVQVKGTTNGTITNLDGQYTIQTKMNDILVFSTIGMKTVERKVSSNSPINISMSEDNVQLDQVVVIGYGTVKKSHLSGAVSSVGTKELNGDVATSAANALQGKIAGVSVMSSSGNYGAQYKMWHE